MEASVLPLSIIIVGVGNADFSAMEVYIQYLQCYSIIRTLTVLSDTSDQLVD